MDAYKAAWRGRAILPDAVDEIPCLYQRHAGSLQPFLDFANLAGGVEPGIEGDLAAVRHLFGQPVAEIRQISAYSCRGMNGNPNARISEHAYGNALDIAAFMLAFGREPVWKAAIVGIAVPVALFFMFERWFLVPLPKGPLEAYLGLG